MSAPVAASLGVEIDDLAMLDERLAARRSLARCTIQSLELTERVEQLADVDVRSALFLGCTMPTSLENRLRHRGALVFPQLPDLPFNPYRPGLYTADELYRGLADGGDYAQCPDAQVYAWHRAQGAQPDINATLAMALHDHAISDGLDELCSDADELLTVGIMGGHAAQRGSNTYRAAAALSAGLTRAGMLVMTGGGPGAMEAANLGGWLAHQGDALGEAIDLLAQVPTFDDISEWARVALEVRRRWPDGARSVGIPTWFYGHEPPNGFASSIGKYFSNAIREDTLLQRCRGGIVYLPGAAGTVQEVFQAATGNYYAPEGTPVAPMVLVGIEHWTKTLPVWPLLQALGRGREMGEHLHLVDHVEDAVDLLLA